MSNDNADREYQSGEELLAGWKCVTRSAKLERAVIALMAELDRLHVEHEGQSLAENITNRDIFCSCADAYRIGHAALS